MSPHSWASYQIRKIACCACAADAGNVFPRPPPTSEDTASFRPRHTSRHVRHARAVMHVGIANPRWRERRSRHSWRMCNPQFCVPGKRSITSLGHKRLILQHMCLINFVLFQQLLPVPYAPCNLYLCRFFMRWEIFKFEIYLCYMYSPYESCSFSATAASPLRTV